MNETQNIVQPAPINISTTITPQVPLSTPINPIPTPPAPAMDVKYAGFWVRFVAYVVDAWVLIIPNFIISIFVGLASGSSQNPSTSHFNPIFFFGILVELTLTWLYFILMTHYKGATLGKMLAGITVMSSDRQKLSLGKVILRETVGRLLSGIFFVGYIMVGLTKKKQGLHDMIAESIVIYKDPTKKRSAGFIVATVVLCTIPLIVAILGILSSVVLVSLNRARVLDHDAQVKTELMNVRVAAEVYYSNNNSSYSIAHDCSTGIFQDQNVKSNMGSVPGGTNFSCYAENTTYAISAPLTTTGSGSSYCVDNTGFSGTGSALDTNSRAYCDTSTTSPQTTTSLQTNNTVQVNALTDAPYSFTFPANWQIEPVNQDGRIASDSIDQAILSSNAAQLPVSMSSVKSITKLENSDKITASITAKIPGAKIASVTPTKLAGEDALVTKFTGTVTSSGQDKQQAQLSFLRYDLIHNGSIYVFVFVTSTANASGVTPDFQSIIQSLTFTK